MSVTKWSFVTRRRGEPEQADWFDQRSATGKPIEILREDGNILVLDSDWGYWPAKPVKHPKYRCQKSAKKLGNAEQIVMLANNENSAWIFPRAKFTPEICRAEQPFILSFPTPHSPAPFDAQPVSGAARWKANS